MSVYQRLASGDEKDLQQTPGNTVTLTDDSISIFPLSGRLELSQTNDFRSKETEEWINIFPNAAYFAGYDENLFGHVLIGVYENEITNKICSFCITKFGVTLYQDLILNQDSRFYPSVENLLPIHRDSKVRRALAISNLKNYNKLVNHPGEFQIERRWDETDAGSLASKMNLLVDKRPNEFGIKILQMGLLQTHFLKSMVLDIVYNNSTDVKTMENNNKLVCLLGDQLDQLFDPLLEYSPETLETTYNIPSSSTYSPPALSNSPRIATILDEIFSIQTNFTMGLVALLQNFIIPLRVHVLTSKDAQGITKINHVFPPTIDEITRINCVLHDSLNKAKDFGYVEVIKAIGMILPYFYKPFIRHEANLRNFKPRLNKFFGKYEKKIFNDPEINKGGFSKNYIDSIITGSLLELPRLKLVLSRLYQAITEEFSQSNADSKLEELTMIDYYYKSAIDIIDAFGGEEETRGHERANSQHRIFTPTGKLLTELATNWPIELQYGWLSRKVVGIFELKNVKPNNEHFYDNEVLIIFSDTLLFLRIVEDSYYLKNTGETNLRISDVLMHSLVNEKPLPTFSDFPKMEVSHWCRINDATVTTYKSFSFLTSSEENFLRLFSYTGEGFRGDKDIELIKNYEILRDNNSGNFTTGNEIIELINKAKVLYKNQPFHLFRSNVSNIHLYSTAHSASNYDQENTKSSIILLLNLSEEMVKHYFEMNPYLFFVLTANYTYDGNVQILGFNRNYRPELNEIIPETELQTTLIEILKKYVNCYYNAFTPVNELMIRSTNRDLEYFLFTYQKANGYEIRENMKSRANSIHIPKRELTPEIEMIKDNEPSGIQHQNIQNEPEVPKKSLEPVKQTKKKQRRLSFLSKLFGKRKQKELTPPVETQKEYKELYRPTPKLETVPSPSKEAQQDQAPDADVFSDMETVQHLRKETDTDLPNMFDNNEDHNDLESVYDDTPHEQEVADNGAREEPVKSLDPSPPLGIESENQPLAPLEKPLQQQLPKEKSEPKPFTETSYPKTKKFKEPFESSEESIDIPETFQVSDQPPTIQKPDSNEPPLDREAHTKQAPANLTDPRPNPKSLLLFKKPNSKPAPEPAYRLEQGFTPAYASPEQKDKKFTDRPQMEKPEPPAKQAKTLVPELQPKANVQTNEVYRSNRDPSLEVNSHFEFPSPTRSTYEPDNSENDGIIDNKLSMSIRYVNEDFSRLMSPSFDNFGTVLDDPKEANWIQFSRESSVSSLPTHVKAQAQAETQRQKVGKLRYPPGRESSFTASIDSSFNRDATFANKIRDISAADSFRSQIVLFNSKISSNSKEIEEQESQTSSQLVDEFGREIDMNFSSPRSALKNWEIQTPSKAVPLDTKRYSTGTDGTATSEDEYYSIENVSIARSPRMESLRTPNSPMTPRTPTLSHYNVHGSFSSENTIINELLNHTDMVGPELQKEETVKTLQSPEFVQDKGNDIYIGQFGSMAYLGDILNGTVDLSQVDI